MSIDKIVLKEKVTYTTKRIGYTFGHYALIPFTFGPNYFTDKLEGEGFKWGCLENIIAGTIIPMELAMIISDSNILKFTLAANAVSLTYKIGKKIKKSHKPKNPIQKYSIKKRLKSAIKFCAAYATAWSMLSAGSIVHYGVRSNSQSYIRENVTLSPNKCNIKLKDKQYNFFIVGESHAYNYSSSKYAKYFMKKYNPDYLIIEGTEENDRSKYPLEFNLAALAVIPLLAGLGVFTGTRMNNMFEKQKKEIKYLERLNEEGYLEGTSKEGQFILFAPIAVGGLLMAPQGYIVGATLYNMDKSVNNIISSTKDIDFTDHIWKKSKTELIDNRNLIMAKRSIKHLSENYKPIILVGEGHLNGMIEFYRKQGDVNCNRLKIPDKI